MPLGVEDYFPGLQWPMSPTWPGPREVGITEDPGFPQATSPPNVTPVFSSEDWFAVYRKGHQTAGYQFVGWIYTPPELALLLLWELNGGGVSERGAPTTQPTRDDWQMFHQSGAHVAAITQTFPYFQW